MKKTAFIFLSLMMVLLTGCASTQPKVQKSQLQIREFQTRNYDTNDFKMVMKAVMHTLQDDGFIVKQANVDLGLLTAQKELDISDSGEVFFATLLAGNKAVYKKNSIIESSANISEFGEQIRVRINFQTKVMNNKGGVMGVQQVEDSKFYQEFFSKVDKAVFLGKEKLQ
jgi:cell division protein FtsB